MNDTDSTLNVLVGSFSFKKGLPTDSTEHGGGFLFDCRGLYNPGRLPEFKDKTGQDREIVDFLSAREDAQEFWTHVKALVEQYIESYHKRGFQYASIQFGCTGGQHRSVYFAEKVAVLLRALPYTTIVVTHRDMPR